MPHFLLFVPPPSPFPGHWFMPPASSPCSSKWRMPAGVSSTWGEVRSIWQKGRVNYAYIHRHRKDKLDLGQLSSSRDYHMAEDPQGQWRKCNGYEQVEWTWRTRKIWKYDALHNFGIYVGKSNKGVSHWWLMAAWTDYPWVFGLLYVRVVLISMFGHILLGDCERTMFRSHQVGGASRRHI